MRAAAAHGTLSGMPDALNRYLDEIRRRPLLSAGEELRLARLGDEAARHRLVECNLRLVVTIARRYRGMGLDLLDLIQEGNLGLIAAAERYDWRHAVRFATYASWWIRRGICRALSARSRLIRLPLRVTECAARRDEPAPVSVSELDGAEQLAVDEPDEVVDVSGVLAAIGARPRRILELRYGLDGGDPRTLEEVAAELGISRQRVRKLETRTLLELASHPELVAA